MKYVTENGKNKPSKSVSELAGAPFGFSVRCEGRMGTAAEVSDPRGPGCISGARGLRRS